MQPSTMAYARSKPDRGDLIARAAFARLDVVALAVAMGVRVRAGPVVRHRDAASEGHAAGRSDRPASRTVANFLPGYSVSWGGSLLGAFYAFMIGCGFGAIVAAVWNVAHHIYFVIATTRRYFAGDL